MSKILQIFFIIFELVSHKLSDIQSSKTSKTFLYSLRLFFIRNQSSVGLTYFLLTIGSKPLLTLSVCHLSPILNLF